MKVQEYIVTVCFAVISLWHIALFVKSSIYDFKVKDLNGNDVCLSDFMGKVAVIVNYASSCGFTQSNVEQLSLLALKYESRGLVILLFPSNDFLQNFDGNLAGQKLADDHPEFVVFEAVHVNGYNEHPLYAYLKHAQPGQLVPTIKWNFTKFLVNRSGQAVGRFSVTDDFKDLEEAVLNLLDELSNGSL